ncbi:hypothetical protein EUTSA_v10015235mg [Eutrema salsugineum]|uniref:Uncharacterized protein n=1 Tax=Eutrema salsugineum TaxID=72664 RepID=V4LCI0_EUTSA|nr:hypothetical protein EUTSA_v10015235mg [Eutrema salsugineum]ESQ41420.1 hypothetical protein EUTSA_v10015235mg [Eutrema salsugineum]
MKKETNNEFIKCCNVISYVSETIVTCERKANLTKEAESSGTSELPGEEEAR